MDSRCFATFIPTVQHCPSWTRSRPRGDRAAPRRVPGAPDSRPGRAPMTLEPRLRPAPAPALPGLQRPAGTALSCPSQSAELRGEGAQAWVGTNWSTRPSLTRRHSRPASHTPLQEKRRLGRGGCQRHTRSGGARSRGVREGGTTGMRRLTRRRESGLARALFIENKMAALAEGQL